jgi:dipeptidyl aminopeptidase/acylaminoacyl peptidase
MKIYISLFLGLFYCADFCYSQLDLKEIMKGPDFVGYLPENPYWSYDGTKIYFDYRAESDRGTSLHQFDLKSKTIQKLDSIAKVQTIAYDLSQDAYNLLYFERDNTLASVDKMNKQISLCYQGMQDIQNIQRLNDENKLVFQQGINLFEWQNKDGKSSMRQLTNFILGEKKDEKIDSNFLFKQQEELFEFFKDKDKNKAWKKTQGEFQLFPRPHLNYLGLSTLSSVQINPSGKFIALIMRSEELEKETLVPEFITRDGKVKTSNARAKVSKNEPNQRLYILSLNSADSLVSIDLSGLTDIRKKPSYMDTLTSSLYQKDRNLFIHPLKFSKTSNLALCDIRSADNKDRWIVLVDLEKLTIKELNHQHDDAWIGGPGISSWNEEVAVLDWLEDGKSFYFQSEETGYSHLYSFDIETGTKKAISSGNFEIHQVQLSKDKKRFFITANKTHPGNRDFYHLDAKSLAWTTILNVDGFHDVQVSPDEKSLLIRYSNSNTPWELYLASNSPNTKMMQLTHSTSSKFQSYSWRKPPVIQFKASDGVAVAARIYDPKAEIKNGAAVLFVHGAGYLQNAHNYWSNYYREYMFHNLLCDLGYTVLDVDYRASEGYGRDYRTAIYRFMGGRDLEDFIDAKDFLVKQHGIDSDRVGIYGGSYGGFISLMGLLTKPNEFNCAAALRSVTDWAHYNHEYTSNILNYPETDPDAYRKSSPIYFAENLSKPLIMLHGMVDDNVQFQDVVRLSQRFIELGKKDWDLAVYPVEAHGFREASSWYDEYRRIFELFEKNLIK